MRALDLLASRTQLTRRVDTLDEQVARAYQQYQSRESDLLKNSFLQSLKCESPHLVRRADNQRRTWYYSTR